MKGSNRSAIGNLHESLRDVLTMIRLSGVARRGAPEKSSSSSSGKKSSSSNNKKKSSSSKRGAGGSSKGGGRDDGPNESQSTATSEPPTLAELSTMKTGYEDDVDAADALDPNALQSELDALDFGLDDESDLDDDDLDLR